MDITRPQIGLERLEKMDESESMCEISNRLRSIADHYCFRSDGKLCRDLADRIDAEMVELPRDADGKPIHFGDTVFTNDDPGISWCVRYIELRSDREPSIGIESSGVNTYRPPSCLTHECPDSLKRIADEIEGAIKWCDVNGNHFTGMSSIKYETLAEWADRIRRLAEREASNGTD